MSQICDNLFCGHEATHYVAYNLLDALNLCDYHYAYDQRCRKFVEAFGTESAPQLIQICRGYYNGVLQSEMQAAILLVLMFQISFVFCGGKENLR